MKSYTDIIYDTPWKLINEVLMYAIKPFVFIYLKLNGVNIGSGSKFYGMPKIFKTRGSTINIGNNFEARSWWFSNPLGINHPLIISTWSKNAKIEIGNDVGISGGSIVAAESIKIENRVLIGANSTIIDTDFHPTKGDKRYSTENIKSRSVYIGSDAFIGMNAIILKGVKVDDNAIVPAGEVVRK
jgi:acetyltransferase-like isoleucine patch superfamily enzyme